MRNLVYLVSILSSIFFISCEELDSDIDLKQSESKLVMVSFLSPTDSVVRITLTQTQPLIGPQLDPTVRNAIVVLSDGTTNDTILFNDSENCYLLNKFVLSNTNYTLRASTPEGRWVEASCKTLALEPLDFDITIDSIVNDTGIKYSIKMNWLDVATNSNSYYRTDAEMIYIVIDTLNWNFEMITRELNPKSAEIVKGAGLNQAMSIEYTSEIEKKNIEKNVELHLFMVDEDYYKFEMNKKSNSSGFPNYEYSKIYSNVRNGYGIVASYNNYVVKYLIVN